MRWLFWCAAGFIAYTYAGYPCWLWIRRRLKPLPVRRAPLTPAVSIVLVVRNEARVVEAKLRNLLGLDYPDGLREIVIVSDGSTDSTDEILAGYKQDGRVKVIAVSQSKGKGAGLNHAVAAASAEILVFTDARQQFECGALRLLVENFADSTVGCASGELMLGDEATGESSQGMGLYWRIEKLVRELESASGSVVGATGAIYAVRRELLAPVPAGTILDDVLIPMNVARKGWRVVFDPRARAWDSPDLGAEREFARKVRTLSGNYQLLQLAPWLLSSANPIRFEFVSHKLLRLAVPFGLVVLFITALVLRHPFYRAAWILQSAFYGLSLLKVAGLGRGPLARAADAASTFVVLNTAALVAFAKFITGRKAAWT
ncbi:MAG TPA: glycosyltransferase family 2 protein [Candidatus Aquilonibacter sp.]|nr:glycosyltransferase family 2 protein [Candidatus Aquilonibacter sp.]